MKGSTKKEIIYDYLFVTHLPAFYKVNLYNELAKSCRVFVIFIASSSSIRSPDFTQNPCAFDSMILNQKSFEKRNVFLSSMKLLYAWKKISYKKIVVGGWDLFEFWLLVFFSLRHKNALALESTIFESKTHHFYGIIKKVFLSRVSQIFPSGKPHQALCEKLHFKRSVQLTYGVGIFNYLQKYAIPKTDEFSAKQANEVSQHRREFIFERYKAFSGKFLYVGRLSPEKNVKILCEAFYYFPQFSLTIIGSGKEEDALKAQAPANVQFTGYVLNENLAAYYSSHDVFILPSKCEPWGLVVEEALYHGLPVILSENVGCNHWVSDHHTGCLFDSNSLSSLKEAINHMAENYLKYSKKVKAIDFALRDNLQVKAYLEVL